MNHDAMRDADLDRILADWLSDGAERAPRRYVDAALSDVTTTPQRPVWLARGSDLSVSAMPFRARLLIAAALLAMLAIGVAIGIGAGLLREPGPLPPEVVVLPTPGIALPALEPVSIEDWAVTTSILEGWSEIEGLADYRHFGGMSPEGDLSIGHESPYFSAVCDPDCTEFEVPQTIPYDADKQLQALKDTVAEIAGDSDWEPLAAGVLPQIEGGARLDTTGDRRDGRDWRRIYVVGIYARNLVTFAFSQPAEDFDPELLDAILADTELLAAPVYSDGDLIPFEAPEFAMSVPGSWQFEDQPTIDGEALSGVRRFGEGRILVSFGAPDGTFGWCDPACRELDGLTTLDALAAAVRAGTSLVQRAEATLDGEPSRVLIDLEEVEARIVVLAMHDGRPFGVRIDRGDWDVQDGIFDDILSSVRFTEVDPAPADNVFTVADGLVEMRLPDSWSRSSSGESSFTLGPIRPTPQQQVVGIQRMTVSVGGADGSIETCIKPAAPWESCRAVNVTTLDDLAAAVQPAPIADHGVGPPSPRRDDGTLDGEPSVVTRIQAYEYPARSGQEVVYIVAMHDGRPYIVRIHTTANEVVDLESVIAGFRFAD